MGVRIITGGNFDFFNGPRIKDFAGELNVNTPDITSIFGKSFGFQFGIFNYRYFQADSSYSFRAKDFHYLNAQDAYKPGLDSAKIIRREYSVNRKMDYNIWGVFLEPTIKLDENEWASAYLSLHVGALLTTQTYSPTVKYLFRDTLNYKPIVNPNNFNGDTLLAHPALPYSYKQSTFADFYFGIGVPFKINIKKKLMFNVTPTVGMSVVQVNSPQEPFDYVQRFTVGAKKIKREFVLIKYQLITTVAPIDIAFGGEYRAVAGKMRYFTNYIGAVISLDALRRK